MTTREDIEAHLYRAITGNRLSATTHTVDNAIREVGRRFKQPWTVAGVSRETWRRWNLPRDAKLASRPRKDHEAGLLAVLRRLRLSDAREAKMRKSHGIHVRAFDNYEGIERDLGHTTFDWSHAATNRFINDLLDAYLLRGIGAASKVWTDHLPPTAGWAAEWLHPDSHGSSTSLDIMSISLMGDPDHAGRIGRARRR